MKLILIAAFAALALAGCKGKSPVVHACKVITDQQQCVANDVCRWDGQCKAK